MLSTGENLIVPTLPIHVRKDPRVVSIDLDDHLLNEFLLAISKQYSALRLKNVPFTRFSTARILDEMAGPELYEKMVRGLKARSNGCLRIRVGEKFFAHSDQALIVMTALTYLVGSARYDEMSKSYFHQVALQSNSNNDSNIFCPYEDLRLHTDGAYYSNDIDFLGIGKLVDRCFGGGELTLLHMDDINCPWLDHYGRTHVFEFRASASKNVAQTALKPLIYGNRNECSLRFTDQMIHPRSFEEASLLERLSDAFENSPKKISIKQRTGEIFLINNRFWLHGRKRLEKSTQLDRQLIRIRGDIHAEPIRSLPLM